MEITVTTQAEFDAAIDSGNTPVCAAGVFVSTSGFAVALNNATVTAWGNATVTASDNATVTAWGHVMARLSGMAAISAGSGVVCVVHGEEAKATGGTIVRAKEPTTPQEWCDLYGVAVADGVATLYKGLDEHYRSPRGAYYTPGTTPVAADWDGGENECGCGLHFSPHPLMAHAYISDPQRYVACPVSLTDIAVHPNATYPDKVKAKGCCAPVWECDIDGKAIGAAGL